jgi:hypothetical protein
MVDGWLDAPNVRGVELMYESFGDEGDDDFLA